MSQNESTQQPTAQEFEWGVRYLKPEDDSEVELWGYSEDPRTNGSINQDNEIQVEWKYCDWIYQTVVAVGKRPKPTATWETI
jgi:hypothetical protein